MILRRLGSALRQQDWMVVSLELVIVVAGIFIGLRVDEWSSSRKEQLEEQRYIMLLADDVELMLTEVRRLGEQTAAREEITRNAVLALQNRDLGPETARAVGQAVIAYQISPPFPFRRATYDEMVSTGVFARLTDVRLKRALSHAFAELELARASVDRFRVSLPVVDGIVWSRVQMQVDSAGRPFVEVDPARLVDDVEFRNAMVEMLDIQYDVGGVYAGLEPLLADLLATVRETGGFGAASAGDAGRQSGGDR